MKRNRYLYLLTLLMSMYPGVRIIAQGVCSSSALAPVYSETFGASTSSTKKNTIPAGFVTNYKFNGSSSLSDGEYMVTPLGKNTGKNDWAQGRDHTGDGNGNMYIVNAGKPNTGPVDLFFSKQVDNLCPGSVYSFSAWMANMNTISNTKSICGAGLVWPKVTFNIKNTSGTILQSYTTDTLPLTANTTLAPNWKQYGFQFSLPAGTTSLILEMRDALGGQASYCGNDLAIDDIIFSACTPTATAVISTASTICSGSSTSIDCSLVNSPFSNPAYQWQKSTDAGTTWNNIGTPGTSAMSYAIANAIVADGATYRVLVGPDVSSLSSSTCVTASNTVTLTVNPSPSVTLSSASPICSGNTLSLSSTATGGTSPYTYNWTGPNSFTAASANASIANATTAATGTYTILVTDNKGCTATDAKTITVNTTPTAGTITSGSTGGCVGTQIALGNATPGGIWSSSNTAIATVNSSGLVTITGGGTTTVSYTVTNANCSAVATISITGASAQLHPDVIECNNGIAHFDATDSYYGVSYSNNNPGNSFAWTVTGGPFTFQGSSHAGSQYPGMQFQTGNTYQVILKFTTNGVSCSDTQMVYKNVTAADTIQGSKDTTVCFNSAPIPLSGKVSPVTNTYQWGTSGNGVFSNPNALSTTYTPGAADKAAGVIKIYLTGSSTLNATGNCGTASSIDSMTLRIYPDNVGTNGTQLICSNQALNFTPASAIPGSTYSWVSAVSAGTITGNSPSGTGSVIDSLVNLSHTTDAVVVYTITPYAFTPSNISCSGTPFTFTVTARPKPAVTITNATSSLCTGSITHLQFSSSLAGSTYTWNSSVISGTVTGNSSNVTPTATNTITDQLVASSGSNAIVRYRITAVSPLGCSNTDSTDVLIYGASTSANAGVDQALCNTTSTLLTANNPLLGNGSWTQAAGPSTVVFGSASSASTTLSGLVAGTYRLVWSIGNGTCPAQTDTVVIINAPASVAGTLSSNATVCAGNNTGTLTVSGYTGNIIRWESSTDNGSVWNSISNTSNTYTYTNIITTTLFRAVIQSGVCNEVNTAPVTILVNPVSVPGILSSDATVCASSNSGTLSLAGYTGSIIRWESSVDNGSTWNSISNTTANHDYTNLAVTTVFRAVVESGSCGALSSNTVTITVTAATAAGVVSANATVCSGLNNGTLTLGSYTGTILGWQSSADNGVTWNAIANTTDQLSYNNLTVSMQYRATVQSGSCPAFASAAAIIKVVQAVSTANAGVDQVLCNTSSATLGATTPVSGTGTWSFVSGPSTVSFSHVNDPSAVLGGLTTGVYQLNWTVANGVCAASQDTVQITINPQTVPGTLSASATVCATANSGTLSLTGYTGNIVYWQSSIDNGTTWNNISNTSNQQAYTNLAVTTQYRAAVQSSVCSVLYSNIITITVLQAVTTANAGIDQSLCNVTSATLNGNTPVSGTGTWTFVSGPSTVSFSNVNDPSAVLGGLTTGVYQLNWTVANGVCAASQDAVQITIHPQTVPGTLSASATVCATANSGTLSLTGYTGNIVYWQSSTDNGTTWNNISNTSNQQAYTNLTATTQYRAAVQSGVCSLLYSNIVTITVLQVVTPANAGVDQSLCNVTSATLNGNTPVSGTGTWTFVSGPSAVSFSNANDPSAVLGGLTAGVYQVNWTISNGACTASQDAVQITIHPQTVPGTLAASATVCATANSGTLSLTGYSSSILRWESSTDNGTTWNNITTTSSSHNYTNLTATTQFRAYVQNAVCPALYSNVATINVVAAATVANAGSDEIIVNGVSSTRLNGNVPVSGTGTWTQVSGPTTLTFSNPNDPKATVGGLAFVAGTPPTDGIYILRWTISNGVCAVSEDQMQLTVQPPTNPGVIGPDAVVCTSSNHGTLVLSGYLGTILQWESSIDYGATWSVIASTVGTNQNTYDYNNLTTTTLFRALVQNGVGLPLYSGIAATITVLELVTPANAGANQSVCNNTTSVLAGNTPSSGTGTWSFVSGPSTVSFSNTHDPASVVSGLTTGVYQLAWTISNGICSDSKDYVNITVYDPTVAGTLATAVTVCATANSGTLSLTGYKSAVVRWEYSTNNGSTWNNIASTADTYTYNNLTVTTAYRAYVQNAVCPALYSNTVAINVVQAVTTANAGIDQQLCNVGSATLAANTPTSGTGAWSFVAGPSAVSFTNANDPNTTVNGLVAGTYQFAWTISNGLCSPSQDAVQITVYPPTIAGTLAAAAAVCATANTGTLSLTGYKSAVVRWEYSTNNGSTWNNIASTADTYTYNNLTATTAYRVYVQNAVCPALYSNTVAINVVQAVTTANAGIDQQLCNVGSATLAANTPTSGTGAWSFVAGPSAVSFTNANDPNTTVNGLVAGTYQFAWTISNGLCSPSQDAVQITVYPPTIAGTLAAAAAVCATANTGTLSLTGYKSAVVRWEYSTNNGSTWNNIASTADTYTYNNLTATTAYRAYVQHAVCPALYSNTVAINVVQAVTTANAGIDQQLCNVGSATLAANTPTSGTGAWSFVAGPSAVSFTNANDPNTTVNGLVAGTYQFAWTISNGLCSPSQDAVQITVYAATNSGKLVADAFVCVAGNNGKLSVSGYTGNIIHWESSTDSGSTWNIFNQTTADFSYTNLQVTTQYRVLIQNGICSSRYSNTVTIHVYQLSVGGKLLPTQRTVCVTANTGSLQLGGFTGTIQQWESSTDNGNSWTPLKYTDTSYTYTSLTSTTWFRVLIKNGECSAAYSDTAKIRVDTATRAGILSGTNIVCSGNSSGMLTLSGRTGNIIHWEYSTDNGVNWNLIVNNTDSLIYPDLTANTLFRVLVKNGACATEYSNSILITVVPLVSIANAGQDQTLCNANSSVTLQANEPKSGAGKWSQAAGPTKIAFANASSASTMVTGLQIGTYRFVWTISNGICANSTDTVSIKVDKVLSAFSLASINDCGKTTFRFNNTSQSAFGIKSYQWLSSTGDTIQQPNATLSFTSDGERKMALAVESNTGCTHKTEAIYKVVVYEFPKANINAIADACKSQLFQISSDVNSKDSIAFILWNLGNGSRPRDSIVSVQYMSDGNYTLKLTVATINRCFDSAYKQIAIHPIPVVKIDAKPIVCRGEEATLTANGAVNYIWTDQDNRLICDGCSITKVRPMQNSSYKVIGYNQYGCSQITTTDVRVIQPLKMIASLNDTICVGQSRQLFAKGAASYSWYPETGLSNKNAASPVAKPLVTTTYQVVGKDNYSCFSDSAQVRITVGNATRIHIGNDTTVTAGGTYLLNARPEVQDIRKWYWSGPVDFSCKTCPTPQVKVTNDASILCLAINAYGCTSTDTLNIKTYCPSTDVFIPNAFSPDGDGVNDVLMVQGKGIKMIKSFRIFNRWGEIVFEKTNFLPGDPAYAWDGKIRGKAAPPDVFVYVCEVICEKGIPSIFKGNTAVLK